MYSDSRSIDLHNHLTRGYHAYRIGRNGIVYNIISKMPEGPATIKIEAEGYKALIRLLDIRANSYGRYFKRFNMEVEGPQ